MCGSVSELSILFHWSVFSIFEQTPHSLNYYSFLFLKKVFIYLFIYYFWLCWVFVVACGLSLVAATGGCSSLRCAGFSLQWLLVAGHGL